MMRYFLIILLATAMMAHAAPDDAARYRSYRDMPSSELLRQSSVAFNSGEYNRALEVLASLIARIADSDSDDDRYMLARAYNNLGLVYFYAFSDYTRAHDYFLEGYSLAEQHDYADILPAVHLNLANVYAEIDDYGNAMQHYRMAFRLGHERDEHNNIRNATVAFINLVGTAVDADSIGGVTADVAEMQRWQPTLEVSPMPYARIMARGMQHMIDGDTEAALATLDSLQHNIPSELHGSQRFTLVAILTQAYVLEKGGRLHEAAAKVEAAQQLSAQYGNMPDVDIDILTTAARLYTRLGRSADALAARQRALDLQDSILSNKRVNLIHESTAGFTLERYNRYAREMETRRRQGTAILWGVALLALVAVGVALLVYRQKKRLEEKNRDLYRLYTERTAPVPTADNARQELLTRLTATLRQSPDIYNPGFSLNDLAALLDTRPATLSQAINDELHLTFPALLAEYRVREATRRLSQPDALQHITVETLAQQLGFKSRTNFAAVFKRITGMTPSEFYKNAQQR